MLRTTDLPSAPSPASCTIRLHGRTPAEVFAFVTDIDALPSWNDAIEEVVERPAALVPGAVWRVRMRADGVRWTSRSVVVCCHVVTGDFVYRSGTDDGNPSYTEWRWRVRCDTDGVTTVTVSWHLVPMTSGRRWLAAPFRARRLRREVPTSLARLVVALDTRPARADEPA